MVLTPSRVMNQIEIGLQAYQIDRGVIGNTMAPFCFFIRMKANQCNHCLLMVSKYHYYPQKKKAAEGYASLQQVSFTRFCPRNYKPTFRGLNLQVHRTEYGEAFTAVGERCAIEVRK